MENKQTVGAKIAVLRKARGLTQADIGEYLNISYQAVSKWERDESCPDFDTLSKLAQFFGVPISYFEKGGEEIAASVSTVAPVADNTNRVMLGVCKDCGRVVYEGNEAVLTPELICKECDVNRKEKERKIAEAIKRNAELKKQELENQEKKRKANIAKARNKGLIWGGIAGAIALFFGIIGGWESFLGMLVFTVFLFPFIAQLFWDGAVVDVVDCGGKIIGTPGIIFTFDLDGFIFLIGMKILFAVLRFLVYIFTFVFFLAVAAVISPFTFVPALLRVNKEGVYTI